MKIKNLDQLEALPIGGVIQDRLGDLYHRSDLGWEFGGEGGEIERPELPATLLIPAVVTDEMVRDGAYALDAAAMDSPADYPLQYEQAMQLSRDVLEAAFGGAL